jgi:hypothetical protein
VNYEGGVTMVDGGYYFWGGYNGEYDGDSGAWGGGAMTG